ncbi:hypothetical protein H7H48_16995 [Nitratireductor sp. B36]|uniref:hypothetical protein n=1 Tax=Nitratireductor sp. B36 TaxID=2762059 RepID=UPI001E653728|nr:hypothetical protein [Nitratireductor sp. B36]MCC5780762.1 hypothetical protein [Nitratireductor sp. B36]
MLEIIGALHVQIGKIAGTLGELLVGPEKQNAIIAFLHEWQTLIAGGLALIGASFVYRQLLDERRRHRLERERRTKAARIRTPHALQEIHNYLDACLEQWIATAPPERVDPPFSALNTLMEGAVDVDEQSYESIQELVFHAQAFDARVSEPVFSRPMNYRGTMGVDLMTFYYLADRLYDFGRMRVEKLPYIPPTRHDLCQIFAQVILFKKLSPDRDEEKLHAELSRALDIRFPETRSTKDLKSPASS